ncbi:hypothetical protein B0H14DRAFT_2568186 [Mycena olivaceomarginata]|nr:hypothetical protein B0H14DRAFT_2568186 [Mycena olivaceomarginata]
MVAYRLVLVYGCLFSLPCIKAALCLYTPICFALPFSPQKWPTSIHSSIGNLPPPPPVAAVVPTIPIAPPTAPTLNRAADSNTSAANAADADTDHDPPLALNPTPYRSLAVANFTPARTVWHFNWHNPPPQVELAQELVHLAAWSPARVATALLPLLS